MHYFTDQCTHVIGYVLVLHCNSGANMNISVTKAISDKLHREIMVKQLDLIFICLVVSLVMTALWCNTIHYRECANGMQKQWI